MDILKFGNEFVIQGVVFSNGTDLMVLPLPEEYHHMQSDFDHGLVDVIDPRKGVYEEIIHQLDTLKVEAYDDQRRKVLVRKSQRQLSTKISWQVFHRDGYRCRYCGKQGVPLSYDHVMLWEKGGPNTVQNGVTACKKCNRTRGNTEYPDWLVSDYYLGNSDDLTPEVVQKNEDLVDILNSGKIKPREYKRKR